MRNEPCIYDLRQLREDVATDLRRVGSLVSDRPIDDSLSLWLEVGMITPVLRLLAAIGDLANLDQLLPRTCVQAPLFT